MSKTQYKTSHYSRDRVDKEEYISAVRSFIHDRLARLQLSVGRVDTAAEANGYQRKTNLWK